MKYNQLELKAHKSSKRVGRGIAAGGGKTAGRGTKGQKSRTGKKIKLGFEGGQTKLSSRLPKKSGFKAINRVEFSVVNLDDLSRISGSMVDNASLVQAGLIHDDAELVKLLGDGKVTQAYTVKVAAVSQSANKAIEAAGGKVEITRPKKTDQTVAKTSSERDNKATK